MGWGVGLVAWWGVDGREADRGVTPTLQDFKKCPLHLCSQTCVFSQALTDAVTSMNTATKSFTGAAGVGSTESGTTGSKKKVSPAFLLSLAGLFFFLFSRFCFSCGGRLRGGDGGQLGD